MDLPPYPNYKPSGSDWLGDVPTHWDVKRLKYAVTRRDEKVEADEDAPLPYVGLEHVESWTGKLLPLDHRLIPAGIAGRFTAGDILFGKLRPYLAKATAVDFDGLCSTELLALRAEGCDRRFLLYHLLSDGFISLVDSSTYGAKMPRASWDFIGSCAVTLPTPNEQSAIADFLDARTAKLDALVAKKRAFVDALEEERAGLITEAVTRGLPNDHASTWGAQHPSSLRAVDIGWLDAVPEHWEVKALKRTA